MKYYKIDSKSYLILLSKYKKLLFILIFIFVVTGTLIDNSVTKKYISEFKIASVQILNFEMLDMVASIDNKGSMEAGLKIRDDMFSKINQ